MQKSAGIPAEEKLVLGLGIFGHDTSIAFMRGGRILFAAEQERFDRKKHSREIPIGAISAGLKYINCRPEEINAISVNYDPFWLVINYLRHILRYFPQSLRMLIDHRRYQNVYRMRKYREILGENLNASFPKNIWNYVSHHIAHGASAFYCSPFENAAILTSDALGEFDSVLKAEGRGHGIREIGKIAYPHSVGAVYSAITDHLGFEIFSGEGKVMGLAGYGKPAFKDFFESLFSLKDNGDFSINEEMFSYHVLPWIHQNWVSKKFVENFGERREKEMPIEDRHRDLAWGLQESANRILIHICRDLHQRTGMENLCYAGGVALNGYSNTKILSETGFKNIFIQPAANDGGTSLGAALYHSHQILGLKCEKREFDPFLGPSYTSAECEHAIQTAGLKYSRPDDLITKTADYLWKNHIIGVMQGRMEIGPRALGNRSIIANPCVPWMKDHLNKSVKHREPFRPFAPIVPVHLAEKFFEMPCSKSPFMLLIMNVRPEWRARLPAITHVDGTARVQTVDNDSNPFLFDLLLEFEKLSGVPVLLNTSFNGPGEPMVCSPADAIRTFKNHGLDDLILEEFLVEKS